MGIEIASSHRQRVAGTVVSLFCLTIPLLAQAEQAQEQTTEEKPAFLTVTGNATLVNDYIWRGLTQTWGNPAVQAGAEASHETGLYLGLWGQGSSRKLGGRAGVLRDQRARSLR